MPSLLPHRAILTCLFLFAAGLFLAGWIALSVSSAAGKDDSVSIVSTNPADSIRVVSLTTNDIVFNQADERIYASIPGTVPGIGNTITSVNPRNGDIGGSVFVGSEPSKLALARDGRTLYVLLDGAFAIRRYDIQTQTPVAQFDVGQNSQGPFSTNDIVVSPENSDIVAIARSQQSTSSQGVAIYNNGDPLPNTTAATANPNYLAFSDSGSTLFGATFGQLYTLNVDGSGATLNNAVSLNQGSLIKFEGGTIFTGSGQVVNAATRTLLGTFPNVSTSAFATDVAAGRTYYVIRDPANNSNLLLKAFSNTTFTSLGSLTITNIGGNPSSLVKWGTNGLAFRTSTGAVVLIQTSLRPTADPMPTPSPTASVMPTPTPTPYALSVRAINLNVADMIYSKTQDRLYVSVNSSGGVPTGNSVSKLNAVTGQIESSIFVGSEPGRLAIADDQNTLYVALAGSYAVRKVDLPSAQAGSQFYIGNTSIDGASDMAVLPGSTDTVAVRSYNSSVLIFDNGVRRPVVANSTGNITFTSSTDLYAVNNSVVRLGVSASGLTQLNSVAVGMFGEIETDNGFLYSSNGRVFDTATQKLTAVFPGLGFDTAVAVDGENNRAYIVSNDSSNGGCGIRAFELDTYRLAGSVAMPCISGFQRRLVRWGTNGLAFFSSQGKVYIVQSSLIGSGPVPTPTPTVTPTPTPTPAYIPTFIRTLDVPANDIVYNEATHSIIASVPASGGAVLGNTLSHIDPQTGSVTASVAVGGPPNKLAASDDGHTLYTSLDGLSAVRSYNIQSQTPGQQFSVGAGFGAPRDMKVLPGSPGTVALAGGGSGVGVFENGIQRPGGSVTGLASGVDSIDFSSDPTTFYGFNNSGGSELIKFTSSAAGISSTVVGTNLFSGFGTQIKFSNGLLYASSGRAIDPETKNIAGTFQAGGTSVAIDPALNKIFFLSGSVITVHDLTTYVKIGSIFIPNINSNPTSLTRWGTNGLAFRTPDSSPTSPSKIYLVQSDLISNAGTIPTGIQLASTSASVNEFSSSLLVAVSRTGNVSGVSTINYSTTDGTAKAGLDFTGPTGTLTFNAGETTKYIVLPIINDNIFEGTENFTLSISSAGGSDVMLSPLTEPLSILDNDSRPRISNTSGTVSEPRFGNSSVINVAVQLSNPSVETVTVNYSTANGTAAAGSDYVGTSGVLTFDPLETTKTIPITVRADNITEGDENFSVNLSGSTNSSIQVSQAIVTIQDAATRSTAFDYDGDGRSDLSVRRPSDNVWYLLRAAAGYTAMQFGEADDLMAPADYDGDRKTDVAVFRPSNGTWYVFMSQSQTFQTFSWGASGDQPVPTDRDGDGKSDLVVFRPSTNTWYTRFSNGTFSETLFGESGDKPLAGDFDGDGFSDIALFRPSNNNWYIIKSSLGFFIQTWGESGDIPVAADFDGDGKTDQAVFRPSTGEWFFSRTSTGFAVTTWGQAGDIPVAADYDGDGKADTAIFRPSNGTWYIVNSGAGQLIQQFGQAGDIPTQSSFIY